MAGLKLVEELVELCPGRYDIAIIGAEARPAYNRVLLSGLLAGEAAERRHRAAAAHVVRRERYRAADGRGRAPRCARRTRRAALDRRVVAYDRLVLATGSPPLRLPIPGRDLPGVIAFRDLEDVAAMQRARPGTPVVVIGGGLLGVEAAHGLAGAAAG